MPRYIETIYNVLYDRFHIWKEYRTSLTELSFETNMFKGTVNRALWELNRSGIVKLNRNGKTGIEINDVQRIYISKTDR